MSVDIIQKVFEDLSLIDNVELWMSEDDHKFGERFDYLAAFDQTKFEQHLAKQEELEAKNAQLSDSFRKNGNKLVQQDGKEQHQRGLACLNKSLLLAPATEQAAIYRDRIVALEKLALERECGQDIEELKTLGQDFKDLEDLFHQCCQVKDGAKNGCAVECKPGFAPCVEVKESAAQGRYLVAKEDIAAGTLIGVDRPLVVTPQADCVKTHCWHCLRALLGVCYPCPDCSFVVFCSRVCRNEALKLYHT